ncbi:hypothetical protein RRG08_025021 [Elysia crispata]|uniref:Uncharacterized protein n=1 Tax=Elysia crispata TaxID=231223 RepID=A0AAE1APZ5_9GAST|nr:hypothetical protein RRG08_025021 [Elysia crispata]
MSMTVDSPQVIDDIPWVAACCDTRSIGPRERPQLCAHSLLSLSLGSCYLPAVDGLWYGPGRLNLHTVIYDSLRTNRFRYNDFAQLLSPIELQAGLLEYSLLIVTFIFHRSKALESNMKGAPIQPQIFNILPSAKTKKNRLYGNWFEESQKTPKANTASPPSGKGQVGQRKDTRYNIRIRSLRRSLATKETAWFTVLASTTTPSL